jgi:large subunit ribosomal protein L21
VKIGGKEMKYAIVRNGGKQYKAVPGETIQVDRLPADPGKKVVLSEVLFIADGVKKVTIGTPLIKGAKVETTVADQIKGPKIRVFKYKPKVRYRRRQGHRQKYTLLNVDKIVSSATKESSTKTASSKSTKTKTTSTKATSTKTTKSKATSSKTTKSKATRAKTTSNKTTKTKAASTKTTKSKATSTKPTKAKASGSKTTSKTKAKPSTKAGEKDGS